ncbi:delta-like protein 4, partial [Aplysia californica]|uniref:Delta-like protein 4 n=1 Tax=Aplysia californica TaxID=6500 RepID=A0ABM0ZZS5_APLCA
CCVDAHFHTACHFKQGLITGVLCCRLPVKRPNIVVKPPGRLQVYRDFIFLLTCQASGMPPPRLLWYKDGRRLASGNSRISVLSSGDLLVTLARRSDTGLYTCEAINEEGIDTASSYVSVAEYTSGCADDSTDGLHMHSDIQACAGEWKGHVKSAKSLCARGWRVCNPRDQRSLKEITSFEMFDLSGCYAYNAASRKNKCKRWEKCVPRCEHKGVCISHNRCRCASGYKGARCQLPVCSPGCGSKGQCIRPNKCRCSAGYTGRTCRRKTKPCKSTCLNGGRCRRGKCKCPGSFWGKACQYPLQHVLLTRLNRTE